MIERLRQASILALVASGMIVMSTPALADSLEVNIGGTIIGGAVVGGSSYHDNQAGVDSNPALGIIDIGPFLNGLPINFVIQGFNSTSGSPTADLTLNVNANLKPTIVLPFTQRIFITDTGFTSPPSPLHLDQTVNLLSAVGGITSNATAVGFFGDTNSGFEVDGASTTDATSVLSAGVATNLPGFSGSITGPSSYSLTTFITLNITDRGTNPVQDIQLNSDLAAIGEVPAIPEPATILLMGTSLVGLGALFRKKSRRS